MAKNSSQVTEVKRIVGELRKSLRNLDRVNAIFWLLGKGRDEYPAFGELFDAAVERHEQWSGILKQLRHGKKRGASGIVQDLAEASANSRGVLENARFQRKYWEKKAIRILCSEPQLHEVVGRIKREGVIRFTKDEAKELFDFSPILPFWDQLPGYTLVFVGGGIHVSSPEADLFEAMCWFHDEATRSASRLEELKPDEDSPMEAFTAYNEQHGVHSLMCRETLLSAFVLVEAFLNAVAHAHAADESAALSDENRLDLLEQRLMKDGRLGTSFVRLEDKVTKWVALISPRGESFSRGEQPFQAFKELKKHRDAMVHLAAPKVAAFRDIDYAMASKASTTVCEMIRGICKYTAQDADSVSFPFWYQDPGPDGLFNFQIRRPIDVADFTEA